MADAVRGYARRLHGHIGPGHHVASPLGAWLVLALAASADTATDAEARTIEAALGLPAGAAGSAARALLDAPPPAVTAAAAAWVGHPPARGPAAEWLAQLPKSVARGPVPTQADADAWARQHSLGMIDAFPVALGPTVRAVLCSAVATRISWSHPFGLVAADVFRSTWRSEVSTVLHSPRDGHHCRIVGHPTAGELAVHRGFADGLTVTSVIAAPGVAPFVVLDAAHDVAGEALDRRLEARSLFDLPLGDGPAWTITETPAGTRAEHLRAALPAWSARSVHDVRAPALGFGAATAALGRLFDAPQPEAAQAVAARYHRRGFAAAAVTAAVAGASRQRSAPGLRRDALLRFDRPYAVVATAVARDSVWHGLPVFSAWVTTPEEPKEDDAADE